MNSISGNHCDAGGEVLWKSQNAYEPVKLSKPLAVEAPNRILWRAMMNLYHRTSSNNAKLILENGFRDGRGTYMTRSVFVGVWLSDVPLDGNEGAHGDTLLVVDLELLEFELADYEWVEEGRFFREWLIPAAVINQHGKIKIQNEDDYSRWNPRG